MDGSFLMRRWTIWSKAGSHPAAPLETRCREYGPLVDGGTRSGVGLTSVALQQRARPWGDAPYTTRSRRRRSDVGHVGRRCRGSQRQWQAEASAKSDLHNLQWQQSGPVRGYGREPRGGLWTRRGQQQCLVSRLQGGQQHSIAKVE